MKEPPSVKALTLLCKEMRTVINTFFSFSMHNLRKLSNPRELLHWGWIIYRCWAGVSASGISAAPGATNGDFLEPASEFSYTPTQSITLRQEMCHGLSVPLLHHCWLLKVLQVPPPPHLPPKPRHDSGLQEKTPVPVKHVGNEICIYIKDDR